MIPLKLLISPQNKYEALEAIAGGADIIDVKNPQEGALGANYPWIIRQIREITPRSIELSCTIGEVGNHPGAVSLAALGAASLDVDYIKVGLFGIETPQEAIFLLKNVRRAVKEYSENIKVAVAGYADAQEIGAINALLIPDIAQKAEVQVAMVDTYLKNKKNIFNYLTCEQLRAFVEAAHDFGLKAAIAGSLRKEDLPIVAGSGADIAGLRSAACSDGNRVTGQICKEKVAELVGTIKQAKTQVCVKRV